MCMYVCVCMYAIIFAIMLPRVKISVSVTRVKKLHYFDARKNLDMHVYTRVFTLVCMYEYVCIYVCMYTCIFAIKLPHMKLMLHYFNVRENNSLLF